MSVKLIIPMRICFLSFFLDSMFPKYVISTDSAYTERYMGLPVPEGNWKGFTESSLIGKAEYIQDNRQRCFDFILFLFLFGFLSFDENICNIYIYNVYTFTVFALKLQSVSFIMCPRQIHPLDTLWHMGNDTIIITITIAASWWFTGLGTTTCTLNTQCFSPKLLSIIKSSSGTFHQPKFCHQILCSNMQLSASLYPSKCKELLYYRKSAK